MGYYINKGLGLTGKALTLLKQHPSIAPASGLKFDHTGQTVLGCVVQNGPFDAAAVAYCPEEVEAFADPDDSRPKNWLVVPRALISSLCPEVEPRLPKLKSEQNLAQI